ncbi:sigma factor regulatory protein, FecR/PupR family [Bordetella bronchiseptica MBORD591]|nr:sigma factor regulatory protein, FecR/PupR family [Bordetella bronchiseptica MBORD591]
MHCRRQISRPSDVRTGPPSPPEPRDPAIDDEAMRWYLALRETGADDPDHAPLRARFRGWLEQDPRHRPAYDACARDWARLAPLQAHYRATRPGARRQRGAWRAACALALVLVVATIGGLAWQAHTYADISLLGARQFDTPLEQTAALRMRDGTRVDMDVGTTLTVAYDDARREVVLESGAAFFDVARDAQRPFLIRTPAGEVHVLGTAFEVQRLADGLLVNVARGHVRIAAPENPAGVELLAGQSVRLRQSRFDAVRPIGVNQVAAWRHNRLVFDNRTLGEVAQAITRRGDWTVHVDPAAARLPITLAVQLNDVANSLQALPEILAVDVVRTGRTLTISARSRP